MEHKEIDCKKLEVCISCNENEPLRIYWDRCKKCWDESIKQTQIHNLMLWEKEAKLLGISFDDYYKKHILEDINNLRDV